MKIRCLDTLSERELQHGEDVEYLGTRCLDTLSERELQQRGTVFLYVELVFRYII